ncbi:MULTISPECIES: MBL fold metallo-hydrolase [unclassified Acidovorax]|uniref:MBL fold metallo-hydrolase n=1 Tax=unclassified Acidovorax TaxID=2684926 RepID=UPI00288333B4|nr:MULTISPECIES: MBL fold metallo-hydrolase [unclassified Acidovorax]
MPSPSSSAPPVHLPAGITVLERGWLSANNIVLCGPEDAALVDSGYCTHAEQTVALVQASLGEGLPLATLVNTHLHSDHCGGNAALQAAFPSLRTLIPPGQAAHVREWNPDALSYTPTGQDCPRFHMNGVLQPGSTVRLGGRDWQVHAAPGHDTHSVVLFEPEDAVLISADALWENGFGVVFPELEGEHAFADVAATLDCIEKLAPRIVIPGHGPVFTDVAQALATARRRLDGFTQDPARHALYAAKVLLKYKLLEWQQAPVAQVQGWAAATPYFDMLHARYFAQQGADLTGWIDRLLQALVDSGAARVEGAVAYNT